MILQFTESLFLFYVQNAAYLAKNQGLSVTDAVLDILEKAGYSNQTTMKVMIQSTNSSVLTKIKKNGNYELVYEIDETIEDVANSTVGDIKSFAHSVVISKSSIQPTTALYTKMMTDTITKLQAFKLPVYVKLFSNEFVSQAWDFFSDATVEINFFVMGSGVDGLITDFPKTAAAYKKNKCLGQGEKTPSYMAPIQPGSLLELIPNIALPPALPPLAILTSSGVDEPPLPAISVKAPVSVPATPAPAPSGSSKPEISTPAFMAGFPFLLAYLLLLL
ncbi:hypothetical protein SAY87_012105 [Trapa incisa]|nr:hypothetical protein SAY87_012105 [Trapa incisa]